MSMNNVTLDNSVDHYVGYTRNHIVIIDISFILRCSKAYPMLEFYIILSLVRSNVLASYTRPGLAF